MIPPLGNHKEVRLVDLGVSKISIFCKTSVLNFLEEDRKRESIMKNTHHTIILNVSNVKLKASNKNELIHK